MVLVACDVPCYRIRMTSSELNKLYVLSPCPCSCYLPHPSLFMLLVSPFDTVYTVYLSIFVYAKSR